MNYPGIYRGFVINNDDSQLEKNKYLGRVQINVPEIYGEIEDVDTLPWAWPCIPIFGGSVNEVTSKQPSGNFTHGLVAIPPIGATVWVMFEQGNIQSPVYMGTWLGKSVEMPTQARRYYQDGREATYPEIFLIKSPWNETAIIRIAGSKVLELAFEDMTVSLKGETAPGEEDRKIEITSETADITLRTTEGKITLSGKEVDILSENDMVIRAGRFGQSPTGTPIVVTEGTLSIESSKDQKIYTWRRGRIQTYEEGGWFLQTPNASGFERHGGSVV